MTRYRHRLPQLDGQLLISDGGIETDLIFHHRAELPFGAAYTLLETDDGVTLLQRYFDDYLDIARAHGVGIVLESPTWRASRDWAAKVGTSPERLAELNRQSIELLVSIRDARGKEISPMVISGCIGPRSDAYRPTEIMTPDEAARYHAEQINVFRDTPADMLSAFTLTNVPEAVGIARAARKAAMPIAISFTVETDGRLPTGATLREAIEYVDNVTSNSPAYYMINCAHPTHFESVLDPSAAWTARLRGIRANSSCKSHAELDESPVLDEGNPRALGAQYKSLLAKLPHVSVLGGCCGTDHRHIREIAAACIAKD